MKIWGCSQQEYLITIHQMNWLIKPFKFSDHDNMMSKQKNKTFLYCCESLELKTHVFLYCEFEGLRGFFSAFVNLSKLNCPQDQRVTQVTLHPAHISHISFWPCEVVSVCVPCKPTQKGKVWHECGIKVPLWLTIYQSAETSKATFASL